MARWRAGKRQPALGEAPDRVGDAREVRDVKGATIAQSSFSGPGQPLLPSWDANMALRASVTEWLVARAVEIIAWDLSSLPLRAGADPEEPTDFDPKSPLALLFGPAPGGPNPEFDGAELIAWMVTNYIAAGRFGLEKDTDGADLVALWPLRTAELFPVNSNTGPGSTVADRRQYFSGYKLRPGNGVEIPYTRDEVAYGWRKHPADPRQAYSPLQSLQLNVNLLFELDGYQLAFIQNDATPATLITHLPFANDAERDAWRQQMLGNHKGGQNAGKVAFSQAEPDDKGQIGTGAVAITVLGASNRDALLNEVYDQQLAVVAGGLGVPLSRLDASGRTYANAAEETKTYWKSTVMHYAVALAGILNRTIAPGLGDDVCWFDFSDVEALKPQIPTGGTFADISGDLLRDERRSYYGLGPVDEKALADEKTASAALALSNAPPPPPVVVAARPDDGVPHADTAPNPASPVPGKPALSVVREGRAVPAHTFDDTTDDEPGCWCGQKDTAGVHDDARHAGTAGHDHVSSGHHAQNSVGAAFVLARDAAIARTAIMLGAQQAMVEGKSERATLDRAEGKRGAQMIARGQVSVDGLYDAAFWTAETRSAFRPVFDAVAAAAEAVHGSGVAAGVDLEAWAQQRAQDVAEQIVTDRTTLLDQAVAGEATMDVLADAVRTAHSLPGFDSDLVADAYDDCVRMLTSRPVESVRELLTMMAAGSIDLDAALNELGGTMTEYRSAPITDVDEKSHSLRAQILTFGKPDTYGSVWETGVFDASLERSGGKVIALFGHDRARPIGSWHDLEKTGTGYEGTLQFASVDDVPDARAAWALTRDSHVTDVSVGFSRRGGKWRDTRNEKDRLDGERERVSAANLDETSIVSHGSVPGASVMSVRAADGDVIEVRTAADLLTALAAKTITLSAALNALEARDDGETPQKDADEAHWAKTPHDFMPEPGDAAACDKCDLAEPAPIHHADKAKMGGRAAVAAWDEMRADGVVSAEAYERAVGSHSGSEEKLVSYWVHGKGAAKIGYGSDGQFKRCQAELGKYVPPAELDGFCARLIHDATGQWPGKHDSRAFHPDEPRLPDGKWGSGGHKVDIPERDKHGAPRTITLHDPEGNSKGKVSFVEAAEMMHGTGSKQHLAAIKKYGKSADGK